MPGYVKDAVPHTVWFYQPMLTRVVLPHAALFAGVVAVGELVVGAALFLGVGTRGATALGALLTINYFLLNGLRVVDVGNDLALMVGCVVVLLSAAGRTFGIDAYLARRWPAVLLW
jgi:uncharacterized membrane protein YphA (DoxX/SURF4 family)